MKFTQKLLPFAIAAVMPVAAIAEGPIDGTVYGKVNLTVENQDYDTLTDSSAKQELESNASRLGFKGKTKISDSLSAIYQLEYEVAADDGDPVFKQRNIYIGLAGNFGAVIAGNHDTPTKLLQNKVDLFNDLKGDIKNVITRSDVRAPNTVMYSTPEMGGFFGQAAYVMSEDADVDSGYSLAAGWNNDLIYAGLSYDQDIRALDSTVVRGVVQAKLGSFQLGLLAEQDDTAGSKKDAVMLSGQFKTGNWAFKAQYGQSDIRAEGGKSSNLGVDYKLAKNTKVFGFYTMNEADVAESFSEQGDFFGIGMEHKF